MMTAVFRALSCLVATALFLGSNAQFFDDFTDGDFTADPVWQGDLSVFIVNGTQQLQLNNTVAASSQLHSPNAMTTLDEHEWRVRVKQSFSGSSSNFGRVYLVSDQPDLSGPLNGYYLQFGEAGSSDAIELFEQTGTTSTSICRGTETAIANPFDVGVQVIRDASGNWQLSVDPMGGTNYILQASGPGIAHTTSNTIGVTCTYTVSNADKFYYDSFYAGPIQVDNTPPTVLSASIIAVDQVEVLFSEPVDETTAEDPNNYTVIPFNGVTTAVRNGLDPAKVTLLLTAAMVNGNTYTLTVNGVQDLAGNASVNSSTDFAYVVPIAAEFRDVVINEIMADPTPTVGLPDVEFVELYNATSDRVFDLAGWTFGDGGTPVTLPTYTLAPGEYVVLMANASLPLFPSITNKIGVPSLPALNNDTDPLDLRDENAFSIDNVTYALSWYQDAVKDDGGWTLEQIDPTAPCSGASNWRASNATLGGTPGTQNSIYAIVPDIQAPSLVAVQVPNASTLEVVFSEDMDASSLVGGNYFITPTIATGDVFPNGSNGATIVLLDPLAVGTVYSLVVEDVSDCTGNLIGANNTATFGLPEAVAVGDVVINEVLYDPVGTGSDMVELYNQSTKILSLAGWQMANVSDGVVGAPLVITSAATLLVPGGYVLLCEDQANIVLNYPQSRTDRFLVTDLPSYNNENGSVVLQAPDGTQLDRFDYDDDLHFALLNKTEGYSLERVDPDRPTSDNTNWQSAADVAGKATPGFQNSQYAPSPDPNGEMTIEPAIFSPDNDGFQDVLTIAYRMDQPGFAGNITIYDPAGREALKLMENELLGTSGAVSWNGILDSGSLGRMGPYIVVFEAFDLGGNVERYKQTVTLAHRLN